MMAAIKTMRATSSQVNQRGFTLIQMIIIVAMATVITAFGAIGVVNARAHMRLASSARHFSTRAEKARADSVRRHAMGGAMSNLVLLSTTSYSVTMDWDTNGVIDTWDTQTFNLETDITFAPELVGTTITFDWRGRSVTGQVAPTLRLWGGTATTLITISGSGDITLDAESFPDGAIPDVTLNGDLTSDSGLRPDPPPNPNSTPYPDGTSPTPTPTPPADPNATPTPTPYPTPTPTPTPECNGNAHGCRDDATPTPTPAPTPQPTVSPTPYPTTGPCTLTASPYTLSMANKATRFVTLTVANSSADVSVSLSGNTNSSHISVTLAPGQSGRVTNGSGAVSFVVVMNGNNKVGTLSFTASSPCSASASVGVNRTTTAELITKETHASP